MIAEPTGTDGHRTIGRPWHAFLLKCYSVAEAISWSTRNVSRLPHLKKIRSPLPLTIRCWYFCLTILKLKPILAGRSHPPRGQPYFSGSSKGNHSVA